MFIEKDIEVLEVNPLVMTKDEQLFVNSAKVKIDQNSYFRQRHQIMQRDLS